MRSLLLLGTSLSVMAFATSAIAEQQPAATATAINIQTITSGQTINSTLNASDAKLEADNSPIEIYKVRARSGQRVTATMKSTAFSSMLNIGSVQNGGECEDCNAAAQEESDAAVARYVAKADGFIYIRTNTLNATDSGAYTLNVVVADAPRVTYTPITYGRLVQGRLSDGDALDEEGKSTDNYSLTLPANKKIQIDLSSEAIDPLVKLTGPNKTNAVTQLADDDDSGPGTNARIRFTTEAAGVYKINVSAVGDNSDGAYSLLVGDIPPRAPLPAPRVLSLGTSLTGNMTIAGPKEEIDGEDVITQRYRFMAQAGQIYAISAKSSAFDPMIDIGTYKANGDFEALDSDDDGGADTDSLIRFKPTTSGPFIIRVREVGTSDEDGEGEDNKPKGGAYTLSVNTAVIAPAPSAGQPIAVGQTINGELKDGGPRRTEEDALYNAYAINLSKGQKITIEMKNTVPEGESEALDSYLEIGTGSPANFKKSAEDDDGGKELNAKLKFEAPENGSYLIRATTLASGAAGAYTISVVNTPPPAPQPTPIAINIGETKEGALAETDATYGDDEAHYKLYTFNAAAGASYIIELESAEFDPIVFSKAAGANDDTYKSDDDSGGGEGGLNAKLEITVENAGPQTIRAGSVASDGLGKFKLKVTRK